MKKRSLCFITALLLIIVSLFSWKGTEMIHVSATDKSDSGLLCAICQADLDMEALPAEVTEVVNVRLIVQLLRIIPIFITAIFVVLCSVSDGAYKGLIFRLAYSCADYHIFFMHAKDGEK